MTTIHVGRTDDIVDAEIVGRATLLRQAAAAKAKAGLRGFVAGARRLGHGLAAFPVDVLTYWGDLAGAIDVAEAAPGDPTTKAKVEHETTKRKHRANVTGVVLASLAWCTAGWTALAATVPGPGGYGVVGVWWLILLGVTCLASRGVWGGKHKDGWLWPTRLWGAVAAGVVGLFAHLALGWSALMMTGGWLVPVLGWLTWAASDGEVFGDGGPAQHATEIATDTRYNRITAGFATVLKIKDDGEQIKVIGPGLEPFDDIWSKMRLQFPGTITNDQIQDAIPGVASFMGISAERLDAVGVDDGHGGEIQGVVDVWLASGDQWQRAPQWPPLTAEQVSVWEPAPFIVTDRGTPVTASLLFAMWMLISKPRHGKTFAMRLLALLFALDPSADYAVFDFKVGGRDWLWARKTAVGSGFGNSDATVKAFLDYLESVLAQAEDLGALFQALPEHLVPHGQLTREACAHEPRLRPLGIFADEVHFALMHPQYGKKITTALSRIARELPFLAVTIYIASQRADVRTSIPSEVRDLAANRVAGKLYTSRASGDVLGDAANDMGYNAKTLRPVKGLFIVHGADDTSSFDGYTRGRAYLVDNVQAQAIGERALRLRESAGTKLPQPTAAEPAAPELLAVAQILREHRDATGAVSMLSEDVATRLETTPQRLRERTGVRSRQCREDAYRRHLFLEDVEAAVAGCRGGRAAPLRVVG